MPCMLQYIRRRDILSVHWLFINPFAKDVKNITMHVVPREHFFLLRVNTSSHSSCRTWNKLVLKLFFIKTCEFSFHSFDSLVYWFTFLIRLLIWHWNLSSFHECRNLLMKNYVSGFETDYKLSLQNFYVRCHKKKSSANLSLSFSFTFQENMNDVINNNCLNIDIGSRISLLICKDGGGFVILCIHKILTFNIYSK